MQNKEPKSLHDNKKIALTSKEISELFAEGVITVILLLLLNVSLLVILSMIIKNSPNLQDAIFETKFIFSQNLDNDLFWSGRNFLIPILLIIDALILYWRLHRRYKQMQLRHIISELHYIAEGNYDYRIPFELKGDLNRVIQSINGLVDSTITAIEEERKIEQSKDELITNVSHDIRTPLTSIIGYLGLIEDNQYHSEEELLKYTHTAFIKAKQMKSLVEDLFEYTKVRQSSVPIYYITFDMVQLVEQLAVDFELEAAKKEIEIIVHANQKQMMMEGDTEKIVRVFNNLISNALKYGKGATQIIVELEQINQEVIITVKNNGQMIPQKSLEQLFDRFYRVEESRSQETGGSGLGLAIAQNIIALHGGYIYAKSNPEWTSFIIHLPIKKDKVDK